MEQTATATRPTPPATPPRLRKLYVALSDECFEAVVALALRRYRTAQQQAALLIDAALRAGIDQEDGCGR